MAHMTWDELRQLPSAVDLETAGPALGIGRSKIYAMAKTGKLQQTIRVLKFGRAYRVVRAGLYRLLGVSTHDGPSMSAISTPGLDEPRDAAPPGRTTALAAREPVRHRPGLVDEEQGPARPRCVQRPVLPTRLLLNGLLARPGVGAEVPAHLVRQPQRSALHCQAACAGSCAVPPPEGAGHRRLPHPACNAVRSRADCESGHPSLRSTSSPRPQLAEVLCGSIKTARSSNAE